MAHAFGNGVMPEFSCADREIADGHVHREM